ncbi:MAG: acyl-CoA dehydrogenase family protein [Devosia sp.]
MDIRLTDSQQAFRQEVRTFIAQRLPRETRQSLRRGFGASYDQIRQWQAILHEKGWAAPHWPKQYGGAGLGEMERLIVLEENYLAPAPQPVAQNVGMLGPVLLAFGTEEQKSSLLPRLASGELFFCQGFSEPGAGSDLAGLRTAAQLDGEDYIVNGQKIWTSGAHVADWIFCLVRTSREQRKQDGISFLMIDMRTPGITVRPIRSIDGEHHLNEVFFDGVRVPRRNLVGEEGKGWSYARYLLGSERIGTAHVGLCRERLHYARELRGSRRAGHEFDRDLGLLEAEVRALEITQLRMLTSSQAGADRNTVVASVLKLKGVELQQSITLLLQRMSGPSGIEARSRGGPQSDHWAAGLGKKYLFLRAASIYGGTSEIQREIVARAVLGNT